MAQKPDLTKCHLCHAARRVRNGRRKGWVVARVVDGAYKLFCRLAEAALVSVSADRTERHWATLPI